MTNKCANSMVSGIIGHLRISLWRCFLKISSVLSVIHLLFAEPKGFVSWLRNCWRFCFVRRSIDFLCKECWTCIVFYVCGARVQHLLL